MRTVGAVASLAGLVLVVVWIHQLLTKGYRMSQELEVAGALDREKIELIKKTVAKGATDTELALFVDQCNRTQLDPFARQVYLIERYNAQAGGKVKQVQISIDGFRLIAQRSGEYAGQTATYWCGPDGEWKDIWLASEPPAAAKVGVYRRGFAEVLWGVARWDAYVVTYKKDGKEVVGTMWKKMPDVMLGKCAEMLALRKAFPQELSGLYGTEEMEQAGGSPVGAPGTPYGPSGDNLEVPDAPATAAKPASRRRAAPKPPPTESETLKAQGAMTPQGPTDEAVAAEARREAEANLAEARAMDEAAAVQAVAREFPGATQVAASPPDTTTSMQASDGIIWSEKLTAWVNTVTGEVVGAGEAITARQGEPLAPVSDIRTHEPLTTKELNLLRKLLAKAGHPEDLEYVRQLALRTAEQGWIRTFDDVTPAEFERLVLILTPDA